MWTRFGCVLIGSCLSQINKPLMERKRRARINESLNELKTLVLAGMKKDVSAVCRSRKNTPTLSSLDPLSRCSASL